MRAILILLNYTRVELLESRGHYDGAHIEVDRLSLPRLDLRAGISLQLLFCGEFSVLIIDDANVRIAMWEA